MGRHKGFISQNLLPADILGELCDSVFSCCEIHTHNGLCSVSFYSNFLSLLHLKHKKVWSFYCRFFWMDGLQEHSFWIELAHLQVLNLIELYPSIMIGGWVKGDFFSDWSRSQRGKVWSANAKDQVFMWIAYIKQQTNLFLQSNA